MTLKLSFHPWKVHVLREDSSRQLASLVAREAGPGPAAPGLGPLGSCPSSGLATPAPLPRKGEQPCWWAPSSLGQETVGFVTSSKGEAEPRQLWAGRLLSDRAGPSHSLWSLAQEPGPFFPHTSMPRSRGPEHVAEAPHALCDSLDHPGGSLA